jgi:NAD-dependent dihydropyrimidine dehydrogenase PreA subunit
MYPRILIDYTKCKTPFDCKVCLQLCPQAVFDLATLKYERLKETNKREAGAYQVAPVYRDRCSGCGDCVKACPLAAIVLSYPKAVRR